jgi:hypothetical protein
MMMRSDVLARDKMCHGFGFRATGTKKRGGAHGRRLKLKRSADLAISAAA